MGHQETVEEMRAEKAEKYNELKDKKKGQEYDEWFLRYRPAETKEITSDTKKKTKRNKRKKRNTRKRKGIFF
jgi:hypothetical protein